MALERYVISGAKKLRCGFTTGVCAAAAAKAATVMLISGKAVEQVAVTTPNDIRLVLEVEDASCGDGFARCAVRKDAGDDADVTDGTLIYASVRLTDKPEIVIEGGMGVGWVTCPGLDQPVGAAAKNRVPRLMIARWGREALADGGAAAAPVRILRSQFRMEKQSRSGPSIHGFVLWEEFRFLEQLASWSL